MDDASGGHFDIESAESGTRSITLSPPIIDCGLDCLSWSIWDYEAGAPTGESGGGCTATFDLPSGDWKRGVTFVIGSPPPPPNCLDVTGPDEVELGTTAAFNATYEGTVDRVGFVAHDIAASCGANPDCTNENWQSNLIGPGTYSWNWTPSAVGTYDLCCRAWNDGIEECRGDPDCVDGLPRSLCSGPSACKVVNVVPSCEAGAISLSPVLFNGEGDINTTIPTIDPAKIHGANIAYIEYTVNSPFVADILTTTYSNPTSTAPYTVEFESTAIGNSTYSAITYLDDGVTQCPLAIADLIVSVPDSWAQIIGGDVIVGHTSETGAFIDDELPSLTPLIVRLIEDGPSGYPGVPIAANYVDIGTAADTEISSTGWVAQNSPFAGGLYTYEYLEDKLPAMGSLESSDIGDITGSGVSDLVAGLGAGTVNGVQLMSASFFTFDVAQLGGAADVNVGDEKVILFVEGDINITSKIRVTPGVGFFMLIASGDITVDPTVGDDDGEPDLEGVYYTDGNFYTGTNGPGSDTRLHIRGTVVAGNQPGEGLVLQRSHPRADVPSELFQYAPDQTLMIPPVFSRKLLIWKEVTP
ncbi:hypothetical protein ACFL25_00645 [Patescibacteria group bacterium]